jgi:hypothetical protein
MMTITSSECFFVIVLITAFIGLWRGWVREVITTAVLLGVVLFLMLGGTEILYQFIFVNLANAFKALFGGGSVTAANSSSASPLSDQANFFFSMTTFVVLTGLGYLVGHRAGKPPATAVGRLTGIIPGIVNGAAVVFYTTHSILPQLNVNIESPDATTASNSLPIVFGIALAGVVVVLIALSSKKAKK